MGYKHGRGCVGDELGGDYPRGLAHVLRQFEYGFEPLAIGIN